MDRFVSIFLLFIACLISFVAQAGVYKIVDENGRVTYSQYPPTEKKQGSVEEVAVTTGAATRLETIGSKQFCGKISLPTIGLYRDAEEDLLEVRELQTRWQERLDKQSDIKKVSRNYSYNTSRYHKSSSQLQDKNQTSRDLRCALNWAKSKEDQIKEAELSTKKQVENMTTSLEKVRRDMERKCGSEPTYDPSIEASKEQLRNWKKCTRSYRSKERELSSGINRKVQKLR